MTDNEIIKALECCSKSHCGVDKCPLNKNTASTKDCITQLSINALDLINRQKAEIEKLNISHFQFISDINAYKEKLKTAKAEAVKEFAKRLIDLINCIPQHHFTLG